MNLFGIRSIQLAFNGGGSAATNAAKATKLETALEKDGRFELNKELLYLHYNYFKTVRLSVKPTSAPDNGTPSEFIENPSITHLPEVPVSAYSNTELSYNDNTLLQNAKDFSNIAVVVLGRGGSENIDLNPDFFRLSENEKELLDTVCHTFEDVVLILNTACTMEAGFIEDYPSIKSVLWIGFPGESGAKSVARILSGEVNPSGRLPDTWVYNNLNHITSNNFLSLDDKGNWIDGSYKYNDAPTIEVGQILGGGEKQVGYFLQYSEGIYVGYRYFETRSQTDPSFKYDSEVKYPFGYGLSYTNFDQKLLELQEEDGNINLRVSVKNTGETAGKTVIQVYYNPPYSGKIEKSSVNLVTFKKTNLIQAGETEYYTLSFPVEDMASFDYKNYGAYVLESGDYKISINENAHTIIDSKVFKLGSDIIYDAEHDGKRPSDMSVATRQFSDAMRTDDYLTRDWNTEARAFTGPKKEDYIMDSEIKDSLFYTPPTDEDLGYKDSDMPLVGQKLDNLILLSDMKNVPKDDPLWDKFVSQMTLDELTDLCGDGAWHIHGLERLGIPRSLTPDGSMAIAATVYSGATMGTDGAGITYPSPMIAAATWNQELAYLVGVSVANEGKAFGYSGWYAPSMNIQRTPFDGRNFEYYSEDGVLSGKIAAAEIRGATENGIITFSKHFVMHDRQSNGRDQIMVWANEQAIREIYLKPFELAVKEGGSLGIMSSFNYIGHAWAGANNSLLNNVLRGEWGFKGLVITDANVYPHMDVQNMILNGGDLSLDVLAGWMGGENHNKVLLGKATNPLYDISMVTALQKAAKNILYAVSRSWVVE
ncbi:MAG: glycoside hydrolase family 3 N-terminal domain-containing protein [Spirochaetales bacterium]|nr:glycoside hydrolase family 3 N-terminal domain-containing protein [Spirochaetales bacterium]